MNVFINSQSKSLNSFSLQRKKPQAAAEPDAVVNGRQVNHTPIDPQNIRNPRGRIAPPGRNRKCLSAYQVVRSGISTAALSFTTKGLKIASALAQQAGHGVKLATFTTLKTGSSLLGKVADHTVRQAAGSSELALLVGKPNVMLAASLWSQFRAAQTQAQEGCGADFQCNDERCIQMTDLCNGKPDCHDSLDEMPELCNRTTCEKLDQDYPPHESVSRFYCYGGGCTLNNTLCDQTFNCADGSDEADCPESELSLSAPVLTYMALSAGSALAIVTIISGVVYLICKYRKTSKDDNKSPIPITIQLSHSVSAKSDNEDDIEFQQASPSGVLPESLQLQPIATDTAGESGQQVMTYSTENYSANWGPGYFNATWAPANPDTASQRTTISAYARVQLPKIGISFSTRENFEDFIQQVLGSPRASPEIDIEQPPSERREAQQLLTGRHLITSRILNRENSQLIWECPEATDDQRHFPAYAVASLPGNVKVLLPNQEAMMALFTKAVALDRT